MKTVRDFEDEINKIKQKLVEAGRGEKDLIADSRENGIRSDFDLPYSSFPKSLNRKWIQTSDTL